MTSATNHKPLPEHAAALARILHVTRRSWGLGRGIQPSACTPVRTTRRARLAELAARAFEAQSMEIRCRQAFMA